ncbi:MAG: Aminotransferase class-V [Tardiphaga sp.]|nr:Aminotransferase class-V [Tardiphaga sp.]
MRERDVSKGIATPSAGFDLASFCAETPGASNLVHLNAAGAGLPPRFVTETVVTHLTREASVGPHWAAAEAAERLAGVRASVADLLQCHAHHIAFGGSAGHLWAMALLAMPARPGARILVARSEWASNVLNLLKQKRAGAIAIDVMPFDEGSGRIDVARAAALIDERTVAICLPVVASGSGVRQPVEAIAALPRPDGCLLFVDGAQAVGQIRLGMASMGADVLVAPSRKWLRGPRGEAIMALSDRALAQLGDPPILSQAGSEWTSLEGYSTRSDAGRFETYEFSVAGRLGLGVAVEYALRCGINNIRDTIRMRLARLHAGLSTIPDVTVFEEIDREPAFLTFGTPSLAPAELNRHLAEVNIAAAVVDRQYARADLEFRGLSAVNRVAPHAYTSEADIDHFLDAVAAALRRARWRTAS